MKIIKGIIYSLIVLSVIALIAIATLLFWVDPNRYRSTIENLAHEKANISLQIKGDLTWKILPRLGISIGQTSIAPALTPDEKIASVDQMELSLKLWPLIQGNLEIDRLLLDGLDIHLMTDENGVKNMAGFSQKRSEIKENNIQVNDNSKNPRQNIQNQSKNYLNIQEIQVKNAQFQLEDQQQGITFLGHQLDFNVENISLQSPTFEIGKLQFNSGNIWLTTPQKSIEYQDLQLTLTQLQINPEVQLSQFDHYFGINSLSLHKGQFIYIDQISKTQWRFIPEEISLQESVIAMPITMPMAQNSDQSEKPLIWKLNGLTFAKSRLIYEESIIDNIHLSLSTLHNDLSGLLQLDFELINADQPIGKFQGQTEIALNLVPAFKLQLQNNQWHWRNTVVNSDLTLTADLIWNARGLVITPFTLENQQLPESLIQGALNLAIDRSAMPAITGQLKLSGQTLNVETLMNSFNLSQTEKSIIPAESTSQDSDQVDDKAFFSALNSFNLKVDLSLDQLQYQDLNFEKLKLNGEIDQSKIMIQQLSTRFLGSQITANGTINGDKPILKTQAHLQVSALPLQNLFTLIHKQIPLSGTLYLTGDFTAQGHKVEPITQSLAGNVTVNIQQGELKGIDYEALACEGISLLQKSLFKSPSPQSTPFTTLKGTASIRNGIIHNQNLTMEIPGLSASGNGQINFHQETIDYHISLLFQDAHPQGQCQVESFLSGIAIPLRCQGSYTQGASQLCGIDQNAIGQLIATVAQKRIASEIKSDLGIDNDSNASPLDNLPIELPAEIGEVFQGLPNILAPQVKEKTKTKSKSESKPSIPKADDLRKAFEGIFKL